MKSTTTRRALLKAAPIAAVAATVPTIGVAASPPDRAAWDRAMRVYLAAAVNDDAFTPGYMETYDRCNTATDAVLHVTFPPEAYTGGRCQTTADALEVTRARREVALLDAGKMRLDPLPGLREHYATKRELVKAADQRDSQIQTIRDRFNMDALDDQAEELGQHVYDATWVLMEMPAPDLAALRWKLDYLTDNGTGIASYEDSAVAQTLADVARLLPEGR